MDDTTTSEVVPKGETSGAQLIRDKVAEWSQNNRVQLNPDKWRELRVSIAKKKQVFESIKIGGKHLEVVSSAKFVGVTISSDLSWNQHINKVIKEIIKNVILFGSIKNGRGPLWRSEVVLRYMHKISIGRCSSCVALFSITVFNPWTGTYTEVWVLAIMCPGLHYNEALTGMDEILLSGHHPNLCNAMHFLITFLMITITDWVIYSHHYIKPPDTLWDKCKPLMSLKWKLRELATPMLYREVLALM